VIAKNINLNDLKIVAQLPRNTMGKVQKNVLREEYKNSFSGEG